MSSKHHVESFVLPPSSLLTPLHLRRNFMLDRLPDDQLLAIAAFDTAIMSALDDLRIICIAIWSKVVSFLCWKRLEREIVSRTFSQNHDCGIGVEPEVIVAEAGAEASHCKLVGEDFG